MSNWPVVARRIRVPLGFLFAVVFLWFANPNLISMAVGTAIAVPGLLLRALASGHVRKNEALATTGPYAYTRNPLYLGSLILAGGCALMARNWWIGAGLVVFFFAIYLPVIRSEEAFLREKFSDFSTYAREVPAFLPRLSPYHSGGSFSLDLYRKHREYNALIGFLAVIAALVFKMLWRH